MAEQVCQSKSIADQLPQAQLISSRAIAFTCHRSITPRAGETGRALSLQEREEFVTHNGTGKHSTVSRYRGFERKGLLRKEARQEHNISPLRRSQLVQVAMALPFPVYNLIRLQLDQNSE